MVQSYFPRNELKQKLGLSEPAILFLQKLNEFIDTQAELAAAQVVIADQGDAIDAANTDITAANAAINALDVRIDAYDALAPFVRQDQTSAWADPTGTLARSTFVAYAAPDISAAYVEAEVQALADALQVNSQRLAALITDLRANNTLT